MIAIANLCNNETNQTHVGAGEGIKLAVHLCKHSPHPHVLRAAANCVTSLSFKSFINKTRSVTRDEATHANAWSEARRGKMLQLTHITLANLVHSLDPLADLASRTPFRRCCI